MSTNTQKIKDMSFEDAMGELESIVQKMESGSAKLEDSIQSYERGIALKQHCESKLREAQEKIEKITMSEDGSAKAEPFMEEE